VPEGSLAFHSVSAPVRRFFEFSNDLRSGIFGQRLAMPMLKTLDSDEILALQCPREHDCRSAGRLARGFIGCEEIGNAVSINDQYQPAECFPASLVDFKIPLQHSRLTLTKPIDIDGRAEIIEAVESRPLRGSHTEPSADSPSPIKT